MSIEEAAAEVARRNNENARKMLDETVLGFSAKADGRNVVLDYIVKPPRQVDQYRTSLRTLVVRASCRENQGSEAFRQGLFYTFVYRDPAGLELVKFEVHAATCYGVLPWTEHHDAALGFKIAYPQGWTVTRNQSPNVRFSVASFEGGCNVIARMQPDLRERTQAQLDRDVVELPDDEASWAQYMGPSVTLLRVVESRRPLIAGRQALLGVTESQMKLQSDPLAAMTISALAMTPGTLWVLTCQASHKDLVQARADFDRLRSTFDAVFASFALVN